MVIAELKRGEAPHNVVIEIVRRLERGEVLILPTDTVYGLHAKAANTSAVERVREIKGVAAEKPFSTVYATVVGIGKWVTLPEGKLSRRHIIDTWPGAVTWVLPKGPKAPAHLVAPDGTVGIRVPSHPLLRAISTALDDLIISTSANRHGDLPAIRAEDLDPGLVAEVDGVVFEMEPLRGNPSEVIRWTPAGPEVMRQRLREVDQNVDRLNILVVCSGNLCRSPVAALLFEDRLKKSAPGRFIIRSSGTIARVGQPASLPAIEVMKEYGLDLKNHRSRRVNEEMMVWADIVLAMNTDQIGDLHSLFPDYTDRVYLFTTFPESEVIDHYGIEDPYDLGIDTYRKTVAEIVKHVDRIVPNLLKRLK